MIPTGRRSGPPFPSAHRVVARLGDARLLLDILVGEVGRGTADEEDGVHADAEVRGAGGGVGHLRGSVALGLRVAGLSRGIQSAYGVPGTGRGGVRMDLTWRFSEPIAMGSRSSRASSLWPTSSKASVASWPATSSRTSSPPLSQCQPRLSDPAAQRACETIPEEAGRGGRTHGCSSTNWEMS